METGLVNFKLNSVTEEGQVVIAGQSVSYAVRRSQRAKHLRLQVTPDSGLSVVAPISLALSEIEVVLHSKKDWILNQFEYFNQLMEARPLSVSPTPEPQTLLDAGIATLLDSPLLYLGRECHVLISIEREVKGLQANLRKSTLRVTVSSAGQAVAAVEQWYQRRARYYITKRSEELAKLIGVEYNSVTVRPLKTRWGSCSGRRNLNFNWRLIMTPPNVIDYVIIHELCHLIELNHSKRFWTIVASRCPTYQAEREWLRTKGSNLTIKFQPKS